jgi:DHA2 family multidrug resistance protein
MSAWTHTGPEHPPPLAVWIGFIAMLFGNFMALLDVQIVASSIGAIQAGTSASRDEISWVQTSYLIAEVIGIPLSGFLGQALGSRLLFSLSALSFCVASMLCAFSWDLNSLIAFRALQGFCGAPMVPTTTAVLYSIFPRRQQLMAGAVTSVIMTLALSLGPTLGGYIASAWGWRSLFWINVIPGVIVASVIWMTMRTLPGPHFPMLKKIDVAGLIGLALFLGAAEYALEEGPGNDWFASSEVTTLTLVSIAGAVLFFWRARVAETPIVDLRPFKVVPFSIGSVLAFVLGVALFGSVFLTPLFLTSVRGYSSLQVGETMFVQGATMLVFSPIFGFIARTVPDVRVIGVIGMILMALSCLMQSHLTSEAAFWELALPQIVRGAGLVMASTSMMQPALQSLPPNLLHAGAALYNTVRNVGGAFGIATLATVQSHAYALHRQELYAAADPSNPHVAGMIAGAQAHLEQTGAADPARQALMHYAGLLDREALVMAFNDQFLMMALVIALSASLMLFLRRAPPLIAAKS